MTTLLVGQRSDLTIQMRSEMSKQEQGAGQKPSKTEQQKHQRDQNMPPEKAESGKAIPLPDRSDR